VQTFTVDPRWNFDPATELGRAMEICKLHWRAVPQRPPPGNVIVTYEGEWASCATVHAEWEKSDEAKAKASNEAQMRRDRETIDALVKKIGGQK
jgi:hypothetical protein